jgi:hypothetical protein
MNVIKRLMPDSPIAKFSTVTVDGVDVTNECFLADERGVVGIFKRNSEGKRYLSDAKRGVIAKEFRRGRVEISLREDAPEYARKYYQRLRGPAQ